MALWNGLEVELCRVADVEGLGIELCHVADVEGLKVAQCRVAGMEGLKVNFGWRVSNLAGKMMGVVVDELAVKV